MVPAVCALNQCSLSLARPAGWSRAQPTAYFFEPPAAEFLCGPAAGLLCAAHSILPTYAFCLFSFPPHFFRVFGGPAAGLLCAAHLHHPRPAAAHPGPAGQAVSPSLADWSSSGLTGVQHLGCLHFCSTLCLPVYLPCLPAHLSISPAGLPTAA